jgi:hypothetical protein
LGSSKERLFRAVTGVPPQTGPWPDFGLEAQEFRADLQKIEPFDWSEGIRAFYRLYARKHCKPRYGDKTPLYCRHMPRIERLLPEAHFIHLLRDGRDVALSLRALWFAPGKDMRTLALYWQALVKQARKAGARRRRYLVVRYENLVTDPAAVLHSVCGFVGLDFHPAMLEYWKRAPERLQEHQSRHNQGGRLIVTREQRLAQQSLAFKPLQKDRIAGWKTEMTFADQNEFVRHAGAMLEQLGYEV